MNKKIKDLVSNMSDKEKELHKDLIEECLQREKGISQISQEAKESFSNLIDIFSNIFSNVQNINKELIAFYQQYLS